MRRSSAAILLLLSVSPSLGATLTMDEAVSRALRENSGFRQTILLRDEAAHGLDASRTERLPSLSLSASYLLKDRPDRLIIEGNAFAPGIPPAETRLSSGDRSTHSVTLSLLQPLYTGGRLTARISSEEERLRERENARDEAMRELTLSVRTAFTRALVSQTAKQSAGKRLISASARLAELRSLHAEGVATPAELKRAEADEAEAAAALEQALQRYRVAIATLRRLTHLPDEEPLTLAGTIRRPSLVMVDPPLLKRAAAETRPLLREQSARISQAERGVERARSGYLPQIHLVGSYTRQEETNLTRPDVLTIGARAEWSLFEWGKTRAEVAASTARLQREHLRFDDLSRSISLELDELLADARGMEKELLAAERNLDACGAELAEAVRRYREGVTTLAEVSRREALLWGAYDRLLSRAGEMTILLHRIEKVTSTPVDRIAVMTDLTPPDFQGYEREITAAREALKREKSRDLPEPPPPAAVIPPEKPAPPLKGNDHFTLQLGAFRSRENARRLAGATTLCSPVSLVESEGLTRVLCGTFRSAAEAAETARRLRVEALIRRVHGTE